MSQNNIRVLELTVTSEKVCRSQRNVKSVNSNGVVCLFPPDTPFRGCARNWGEFQFLTNR